MLSRGTPANLPDRVPVPAFSDTPILCGHRGSGKGVVDGHAENTLGSFRAAVDAGLRWVEVDARITADDTLVACHDAVTADGRFVAELDAADAAAAGLMPLDVLLDDLPAHVGVDIDVKVSLEDASRPRDRTTAALVAAVAAAEAERRPLLLTSFDPAALLIARERAPGVPTGLLTWMRFPLREAITAAVHLGCDVVAPHVESFLYPSRSERAPGRSVGVAHDAGLQVLAWCPAAEEQEALVAAGVDALVIDDVPATVVRRATMNAG
jgi:glycerophosphoryl diester phosphodiesterase